MQPGRGAGEAALLGDGHEVFQVPKLHVVLLPHSCSSLMIPIDFLRWTS
jgi:hypothetical protein